MFNRLFQNSNQPATKQSIRAVQVRGHGTRTDVVEPQVPITEEIEYTNSELDEYKEVFCYFDIDQSGSISNTEIESAMERLGVHTEEGEVEKLIVEIDLDGNGQIDFGEFCQMMHKLTENKKNHTEIIRCCFDVFDIDKNGFVSKAEFRSVFVHLNGDLNDDEIEDVFQATDLDGNGVIDYEEFTQMVKTYLFHSE